MIDHFTLTVSNLSRSREFYERALKPLGYMLQREYPEILGFGDAQRPYFWVKESPTAPTQPMHIAFAAPNRAAVDGFHQAALGAGARDDGAPGIRERYHANYYGAFVIDPDGHPIEAVCHRALQVEKPVKAKAKSAARAKKPTRKPAKRKKR